MLIAVSIIVRLSPFMFYCLMNFICFKAGTEDGFINIINIYDDSIVFQKLLDKQEGIEND